jgi:hypothetical protein
VLAPAEQAIGVSTLLHAADTSHTAGDREGVDVAASSRVSLLLAFYRRVKARLTERMKWSQTESVTYRLDVDATGAWFEITLDPGGFVGTLDDVGNAADWFDEGGLRSAQRTRRRDRPDQARAGGPGGDHCSTGSARVSARTMRSP